MDLGGWSGLPELERGGPRVSVPGMDLVDGTGGLRRSCGCTFSLRVSGDGWWVSTNIPSHLKDIKCMTYCLQKYLFFHLHSFLTYIYVFLYNWQNAFDI